MSDENFYCVRQDIDPLEVADLQRQAEKDGDPPELRLRLNRLDESLRPCVACGEPSVNRWCSTACFIQEDGYDEEAWK